MPKNPAATCKNIFSGEYKVPTLKIMSTNRPSSAYQPAHAKPRSEPQQARNIVISLELLASLWRRGLREGFVNAVKKLLKYPKKRSQGWVWLLNYTWILVYSAQRAVATLEIDFERESAFMK